MPHADLELRKAQPADLPLIWEILQQAIERRQLDGSRQWQDGYPNENSIRTDMQNGNAYVLVDGDETVAYAAIIFGKEPAYEAIEGDWLTHGDYMVVHRVAVSDRAKGKGVATRLFVLMEGLCRQKNVYSIKVDTNFDNQPMLSILHKLGYTYCGEVTFRNSPRKAFEKVLR